MRYSQDHKAQTHKRIIKEASARFRKDGIGATGLQPLMKALGLTHGGFYSHFKSKDELVEKALQEAGNQVDGLCAEIFAQDNALDVFIETYLSEWHQTSPDEGCPLLTISSELGLRGQPSPTSDVVLNARLEQIENSLEGENCADRAIVIMSTLVGALLLSRSVADAGFAQRILDITRDHLKNRD
ncbi:TetR/AcrR family transcriptional regulator [Pseudomonas sp. Irchel s3h9]|uniref:TetR/AcrR family transcriptional regulator n=1 Tax=Pseudomonas sp. Irchel s3h9 TaxID=2009192 RepID=UPI000BA2BC8C|nr:TetR/AcrR family transcriptional regulator [Pseudomonas sp. Irchel s3h9]